MRAHRLPSNLSGVAIQRPWRVRTPNYDLGGIASISLYYTSIFFIMLYYMFWLFRVLVRIFHHAMCIPAPVPVVSEPVFGVCARVSMSHVRVPWHSARRKDRCTAVQGVSLGPHKVALNHGIIRGLYLQVRPLRAHGLPSNISGGRDSPALACPGAELRFGENNIFLFLLSFTLIYIHCYILLSYLS